MWCYVTGWTIAYIRDCSAGLQCRTAVRDCSTLKIKALHSFTWLQSASNTVQQTRGPESSAALLSEPDILHKQSLHTYYSPWQWWRLSHSPLWTASGSVLPADVSCPSPHHPSRCDPCAGSLLVNQSWTGRSAWLAAAHVSSAHTHKHPNAYSVRSRVHSNTVQSDRQVPVLWTDLLLLSCW